jgi:peptidoglycan/xylan/chitin deacetylase (PgdA/CDA1 family)
MKILSLLWHSIESDSINPDDNYGGNPTQSLFKEQMEFIVENYTPISIIDFANISEDNNSLRSYTKPPVLLGFDDGFRNVINYALPILNKFEIPALFFIMGETIINKDFVPWFIEIKHLVRKTQKKAITYNDEKFELSIKNQRFALINFLNSIFMNYKRESSRQTFLENLSELFEIERPLSDHLDEDLILANEEDLSALGSESLLTISSHALTHKILANLSRQEQIYELEKSDQLLKEHCKSYYPVIAYPNGSFNEDTIDIAQKNYKFGFALFLGSSYNNFYKYPRINIQSYNTERLKYVLSSLRINLLLPIKKILHNSGLRKIG